MHYGFCRSDAALLHLTLFTSGYFTRRARQLVRFTTLMVAVVARRGRGRALNLCGCRRSGASIRKKFHFKGKIAGRVRCVDCNQALPVAWQLEDRHLRVLNESQSQLVNLDDVKCVNPFLNVVENDHVIQRIWSKMHTAMMSFTHGCLSQLLLSVVAGIYLGSLQPVYQTTQVDARKIIERGLAGNLLVSADL